MIIVWPTPRGQGTALPSSTLCCLACCLLCVVIAAQRTQVGECVVITRPYVVYLCGYLYTACLCIPTHMGALVAIPL